MAGATNFSKKCIVFVTGASKGIGQTIAVESARQVNQDSVFVLLARSESGLDKTKQLILEIDKSLTVLTYKVDLSKPDLNLYNDIFKQVLKSIDSSGIEIGLIFHNAAHVGVLKDSTELSDLQVWREYYDLNLFSAVLLNNAFIKHIRPIAPQLVIVNISSLAGKVPFANSAMYGSGKAARELFFKVLALEHKNIIVLNYSPGPVQTDMFDMVCDVAQSDEVRSTFQEIRANTVLTTNQTVSKLLEVLEKGDFKSGDTVDYFDRVNA
ncbi:sepiapterin reductase [Cylas formicarius]|uniref:sepiapterin reductase n=1 Tax=Cylas formicarius TaxID=197179 RepID=UPI0029586C65|nr:sepiapterin reductase [Cylas formicarius]